MCAEVSALATSHWPVLREFAVVRHGGTGMESSDFELLDRWAAGDHEAGKQLFELHFDALHGFFYGKVEDGIDELMEWTLLACVQSRAAAQRDAGFRSYMFRLA